MNAGNIFKLVLKDFKVYGMQIGGWAIYGIAIAMAVLLNEDKNLAGQFVNISLILGMLSTVVFIPELKNRALTIKASLPVARKDIYIAKYLTSFLILSINLILWIVAFMLAEKALGLEPQPIVSFKVILLVFINALFHWAFFYFAFYRFNIIVTGIFYASSLFIPIFLLIKFWRTKSTFVPNFVIEDINMLFISLLVALCVFIVSNFFSLSHFQRKDM